MLLEFSKQHFYVVSSLAVYLNVKYELYCILPEQLDSISQLHDHPRKVGLFVEGQKFFIIISAVPTKCILQAK